MIKDIKNEFNPEFVDNNKKGYTYYYKVRSYKVVDNAKVYSSFSDIKKIISK